MVRLLSSFLALALASNIQSTWAFPKNPSDSTLQSRQDQFVLTSCPNDPQQCSECGGDSVKKGWCDKGKASGSAYAYYDCRKIHGDRCGLICKCVSEDGEPGTGLPPPIIIPFPPPPAGFVPPPAEVPNPKQGCNDEYEQTSCKDCEAIEGWCTTGDSVGCPCREECPADDDEEGKPTCLADDCKGEKGVCTIGHYKECKCKTECPNDDEEILVCSDEGCDGEDDENKCTTDEYNGCKCYPEATLSTTARSKEQVQNDEKVLKALVEDMKKFYDKKDEKTDVKCETTDYSKAINMEASFMNKLAAKFCEGEKKERGQDMTSGDVDDSSYPDHKFRLEMKPGDDCETSCEDAFKSMFTSCQGINSHTIQTAASAKVSECNAEYSYKITAPEKEDDSDEEEDNTFTQNGWQDRVCHERDEFGSHGDVRGGELSLSATGCAGQDDKAILKAGSDPVELKHQYGSTKMKFTMSWVENCKSDKEEVDARFPEGGTVLGESCWQTFVDDWKQCNNGGAGGYIDYGCVRYDFRPTFD